MGRNDHVDVPDPTPKPESIQGHCERVMKLCDATRDGPWVTARHSNPDCSVRYVVPMGSLCPVADEIASTYGELDDNVANASFIASSRTDLPRFVRAVELMMKMLETIDAIGYSRGASENSQLALRRVTRILNGEEVDDASSD